MVFSLQSTTPPSIAFQLTVRENSRNKFLIFRVVLVEIRCLCFAEKTTQKIEFSAICGPQSNLKTVRPQPP
jgi:hypothetical protein